MNQIQIAMSGVTPGTYGNPKQIPTFNVDARGRLTFAADVNIEPDAVLNVNVNSTSDFSLNLYSETLKLTSGNGITLVVDPETQTINIAASTDGLLLLNSGSQEILGNVTLRSLNATEVNTPVANVGLMTLSGSDLITEKYQFAFGNASNPVGIVINSLTDDDGLQIFSPIEGGRRTGPSISLLSSRGDLAEPLQLELGDCTGQIRFNGYLQTPEGAQYIAVAAITSVVSKKDGNGAVSKLEFITDGLSPTSQSEQKASFDHRGVFTAPVVQPGAHTSLPEFPEEGWIVFDTGTKQFKGWNGSAWITLG